MQSQTASTVPGIVASQQPAQVFYTAPAAIARLLCALFLVVLGLMYAAMFFLMPLAEAKALLLPLLPLIGVGMVSEIAMAVLLSRLSPVRIREIGITITNLGGRKRTVPWGEIESVTRGNVVFLPYLKISPYSKNHTATPALIIPLLVTRPQELREAIRQFAPSHNPVGLFLEASTTA